MATQDLADGETAEMQGSGAKPYILKNVGEVYSCSCPAWRNQSNPIEARTCKHLRKFRGEEAEKQRLGGALPTPARRSSGGAKKEGAPPILLAQSWDNASDLKGWWISEKLDGVRAYWDGERFLSRLGNEYHAPDWFVESLPNTPLDGELWIDRQAFHRTVSIVRRQDRSDHWKEVSYIVFDAPAHPGTFEARQKELQKITKATGVDHVQCLDQSVCKGIEQMQKELARVEKLGGEGLMLRQPESEYHVGRSWTLLKVKTFHDSEAIVVGHQPGKGKHKGRLGALEVELPDGTAFSVGTGLADRERENPPEIGTVIAFRFQELSNTGVPRFPSYLRPVTGPEAQAILKSAKTKPSPKKAAKPVEKSTPATSGTKRYFELVDEKSSKFWEVSLSGSEVTVRYGRIDTDGQGKPKDLATEDKAAAHMEKLIAQKTSKGYVEVES